MRAYFSSCLLQGEHNHITGYWEKKYPSITPISPARLRHYSCKSILIDKTLGLFMQWLIAKKTPNKPNQKKLFSIILKGNIEA